MKTMRTLSVKMDFRGTLADFQNIAAILIKIFGMEKKKCYNFLRPNG